MTTDYINKIVNTDCLDGLKLLDDKSINCCVTSPPYWGLRDYGTAKWEGGNPDCDHLSDVRFRDSSTIRDTQKQNVIIEQNGKGTPFKSICGKCGAIRIDNQIGLEQTPEEYVSKMVAVFREVKRVLRDDGTLFLNLGDSYSGSGKGGQSEEKRSENWQPQYANKGLVPSGLKPKDLVGIPWMVALALRADGWCLRQDIIWHKPNPMPESVTDRCTKAHEYIFLMAKSARYYYDNEAIKETLATPAHSPGQSKIDKSRNDQDMNERVFGVDGKRNKRSVWTVTTKPYRDAHFATFPPDLIEPCVLAGCPVNGIVLDPFMGAGTTAKVAVINTRNFIGFELNEKYCRMAERRLRYTQVRLI